MVLNFRRSLGARSQLDVVEAKYQAQDKNVSNVQISSRRLIDEMQEAVWKITEFATGGVATSTIESLIPSIQSVYRGKALKAKNALSMGLSFFARVEVQFLAHTNRSIDHNIPTKEN